MSDVLFCPFCRESFEDESQCPEHELALVQWSALPREGGPAPPKDAARLGLYSPRFGRGWLAAGALGTLVSLVLPLARWSGYVDSVASMWNLAGRGHPLLWMAPAAAFVQLSVLVRRRTPSALRGARLAAGLLALVPCLVVAWTLRDILAAAAVEQARTRLPHTVHFGAGAYVTAVAGVLMLIGAARLGTLSGLGGKPALDSR